MQLLQMWSVHDVDIEQWLREGKYLSHVIINEQIKLMGDHVLCEMLSEIKSCIFYVIQADEATDVACNEQMCVSVRWVSNEYKIFEEPIGLVQMTDRCCYHIHSLRRCFPALYFANLCRGQAYDGASVKSGHLRGVASHFKEEPAALYVHCLAHSLNLCLQDASRSCSLVRDSLELVMEIVKLIKYSPKLTTLF